MAFAGLWLSTSAEDSNSSSSSRPTRSVRPLACSASKRPSAELARSAAQARTGPAMPLRSLCPEVLKLEEIAEELSRALGDDDRVRLGDALQARRQVRRLADDAALLRIPDPIRSPTTTIPVAMPIRVWSGAFDLSALTAPTSSSPARTARSASSSCACG